MSSATSATSATSTGTGLIGNYQFGPNSSIKHDDAVIIVNGDMVASNVTIMDGDLVIDDISITKRLGIIESILNLPERDARLENEYPHLAEIYDKCVEESLKILKNMRNMEQEALHAQYSRERDKLIVIQTLEG